jgi:lysine 2,3-aminomutase
MRATWEEELAAAYGSVDELPPEFAAIAREMAGPRDRATGAGEARAPALPFLVTRHYLSLARPERGDPLLIQCLPDAREALALPYEEEDPLGEDEHSPLPRAVRRYRNRVLLLAGDRCVGYCRHCFRRRFPGRGRGFLTDAELARVEAYLASEPGVEEILVSGGDPLTASDERLLRLFEALRRARPEALIRLCTRAPITLPSRVTPELCAALSRLGPIWAVIHVNHPRELSPEALAAIDRLDRAGMPVASQTVLLKGVNDSVECLAALFNALLRARARPLYLFQGDLAAGTSHLRLPLSRAIALYEGLKGRVSGLALPKFALDLPRGGGKRIIGPETALLLSEGWYRFPPASEGSERARASILYPEEEA